MASQARFLRDRTTRIIVEKSRQVGFSFAAAFRLVEETSVAGARYDAWVSSRDEIQAQLFGMDCKMWADLLQRGAGDLSQDVITTDKRESITIHRLPFASGKSIHSMSSNPDAQAGKRGSRVLDEFALGRDPRQLYAITKPGLDWGGSLYIISTHRGTGNYFNELINEVRHKGNPKRFSLHTITIEDAVRDGILERRKAKWPADDPRQAMTRDEYLQFLKDECADEETWMQEYMCVPGDDDTAFLTYELIAGCEYQPAENWQTDLADAKDPLYVGVDVGRMRDLTVIWVAEKRGDVNWTRRVITLDRKTFAEQEDVLYGLLRLPQVKRCCIDQTGIGRQFAERAAHLFGNKVEGINFTSASKEELAYPVRAAFQDRTVRIPNDNLIRADLRGIRKIQTAGDNVRFAGERTKNGHCDRFWALALSLHAAAIKTKVEAFVW